MSEDSASKRQLVEVVNTPIAYLTLVLLIVDGTLCGLTISLPEYRPYLVPAVLLALTVLSTVVVVLAIVRPEALRGDRPLSLHHAQQFASDVHTAVNGYLDPAQRAEAWTTLAELLENSPTEDASYKRFVSRVSARLALLVLTKETRGASQVVASPAADGDGVNVAAS
jgi:hypothetical protein